MCCPMIWTVSFLCHLPKITCDLLNRESGRIYSRVLAEHWRIYRKHGLWLKNSKAEFIDTEYHADEERLLHSNSINAAQQGVYKAIKTAHGLRKAGLDTR